MNGNDHNGAIDFDSVYKTYFLKIYRYINRHTDTEEDAEDLAEEVFISVYRNLHNFDPGRAKIETWIFVIAKNRLKNYYRDKKVHLSLDDENSYNEPVDPVTPDDCLYMEEKRNLVTRLLATLQPIDRQIVILSYYKEMTSDQIAEVVGLTAGNVRVRLSRALKAMRARAEEDPSFGYVSFM